MSWKMRITETESTLTVRAFPVSAWIWGTVFTLLFGGFEIFILYSAWIAPHDFIGSSGQSLYERGLTTLMFLMLSGFVFAMVLLFLSYMATPFITTTIDRGSDTILIRRRGLWKNDGERYLISQIKEFGVEIPKDDGSSSYVVLILKNDRRIRIESASRKSSPEMIARLNSFIGKVAGSRADG